MSYTALARKWRPRRFSELVGQEHVLRALANALDTGRVHHAFLFTGTRGVGKTTIARILAKCLNCDTGVTAKPCGTCASCREIDEGRFVDLLEVDAASRTKVDDTRELLDNVQYAPTRGRYKVYLIDEVHMLSTHSFNALLKTLEEPPPHVKFLLATTDPQKLPVTVLSRCLQFNLKRLPISLIVERIQQILDAEKIPWEPAAVRLVAQAADGSMRDSLSLLDQLIAFGAGKVGESDARAMLGTIDRGHVVRVVQALAAGDGVLAVRIARELEQWAPDYADVLEQLAALLQRVALRQVLPEYDGDDEFEPETLAQLAEASSPEDVQLFYQTAILGRRDLPLAPDPRTGFEMTLLRMLAFRPAAAGDETASAGAAAASARPSLPQSRSVESSPVALTPPSRTPASAPASGESAAPAPTVHGAAESWHAIVEQLDLQGAARQLAANCSLVRREGATVHLALDAKHQLMRTRAQEDKLAQALSRYWGGTVRLEFALAEAPVGTPAQLVERAAAAELESARRSLEDDPTVQALRERFGATLHPDTVRPLK